MRMEQKMQAGNRVSLEQMRRMVSGAPAAGKVAPRRRVRGRSANAEVYPTCQDRGETLPTSDPCDRAHDVRGRDGFLLRADDVPNATPRRYPPCHLTAAGVSHDTAAERLAAAEGRLRRLLGDAGDDSGGSSGLTAAEAYHESRRRGRGFEDRRVSDLPSAERVIQQHRAGAWRPEA